MLKPTPQTEFKTAISRRFRQHSRKVVTALAIAASVVVLGLAVRSLVGRGESQDVFVYYTVSKTDLPIVVTERGNLESQVETTIACKVENVGTDRSGNYGTQIIHIVPNGGAVEEGQLLVEFDSATIRDRLDEQVLAHQKAISARTQAVAKYNNQLIQNDTAYAEAELAIKLAEARVGNVRRRGQRNPSVAQGRD